MSWLMYFHVFCREFELRILNGSWEDAVGCQRVTRTECDLTFDLGSDSDYNIRVRAECGRRVSPWAELGRPFNRRESESLWDIYVHILFFWCHGNSCFYVVVFFTFILCFLHPSKENKTNWRYYKHEWIYTAFVLTLAEDKTLTQVHNSHTKCQNI